MGCAKEYNVIEKPERENSTFGFLGFIFATFILHPTQIVTHLIIKQSRSFEGNEITGTSNKGFINKWPSPLGKSSLFLHLPFTLR